MNRLRTAHAFLLGVIQCRADLVTGFVGGDDESERSWYSAYDRGRDHGRRVLSYSGWLVVAALVCVVMVGWALAINRGA